MKKATMQDVAKLAGVSQSTVSFVFSGADMRISESTKQKVFEAASELGFAPRGKLKNYHKVSDSVLALLVPNMSNLYYPALAKEVDEIAAAKGYVFYLNGKITVKTLLNVRQDVSFQTGNIFFVGDMAVRPPQERWKRPGGWVCRWPLWAKQSRAPRPTASA